MVKIRGYRVEPTEVEDELLLIDGITQAVVVAVPDSTGEQHLAAYIVPRKTATPEIKMIRAFLAEKLPSYMIPFKFIFLDHLPANLNGKIDRSKLPPINWHRRELDHPFVAPTTSLEAEILTIWKSVLPVEQIGINDNFIELGGNSIQAMQIVARVLNTLGINLSPSILLESSTVAIMSTKIVQHQAEMVTDVELESILAELEQDSDLQ
ncbi:phosphopantetheine-binding protein [Cronbergia sp. UHCC 0137]|uniref:phosphopantetheine-binding protein n=1 Tax=Cronbergia sp. UHCC 0137 TaxID=3110239 RepID=UPI002B1EAE8E|nr:phosphopantetheine-binding protein [Cronbergia sp. UHCC 0137]MEA5617989.1 phosphopantetheine-binding protein [Cronbergia sp. UHCC 0137]